MKPSDPIPTALQQIAFLLQKEGYNTQAGDLNKLRDLALSIKKADFELFCSEITTNKYYWLGMGTIADICLQDKELNKRFISAYWNLANECEKGDLGSIYSSDVLNIFGKWKSDS